MRTLVITLAALAASAVALAADTNPSTFVEKAGQDGMTEVQLGKLAQQKASDADVKSFGARMAADHGKANGELTSIAKQKGLKVPTKLDAEHSSMVEELSGKSGAELDALYTHHMSEAHTKAISLFTDASKGSDAELAAFAKKTLPTLQEHKKMADSLAREKMSSTDTKSSTSR
jgi:putative membrane protein